MPYDSLDSLPDYIRSKPESEQRQWMAVWNSSYRACMGKGSGAKACESQAFAKANGVIKGAEDMTEEETFGQPTGSAVHAPAPLGVKRKMRQRYDDTSGAWVDDGHGPEILLEKADSKVNYRACEDPAKCCGNCRFFDMDCQSCNLVEGTIDAGWMCNLWTPMMASMGYREPGYQMFMELSAQAFGDGTDFAKPMWIPFLPKPGRYTHAQYGEIIVTPGSNQEMVDSVKNHVYQEHIPIDIEHETKLSGAMAWLNDMRMNSDGSADAYVEFTDRGQSLMAGNAFKYVSPEFWPEWRDPATGQVHRNVVAGGAITTRPFFKEKVLRALVASEAGVTVIKSDKEDTQVTDPKKAAEAPPEEKTEPTKATEQPKDDPKAEPAKGIEAPKTFTEDEVKTREAAAAAAATEALTKTFTEQQKASELRVAALEKKDRTQRFTELVAGRGGEADGAPWVGDANAHLSMLESLSEKFGEDNEIITQYIETQKAAAAQIATSSLFRELGSGAQPVSATDADAKLEQMVKARMTSDPALSHAKAFSEVLDTEEGSKLYGSKWGAPQPR